MEVPLNDDQRKTFEEFLRDLDLAAKTEEALDWWIEMFFAMQEDDVSVRQGEEPDHGVNNEVGSRCHLFKMHPDRVEWIGFVRGMDQARDMLLTLASETGAFYFLYDECSGEVVDFVDSQTRPGSSECSD